MPSPTPFRPRRALPAAGDRVGDYVSSFAQPELEVAATVFAQRHRHSDSLSLWELVKSSRRKAEVAQAELDRLLKARGKRRDIARLARTSRTHWAQALLALLAGGREHAPRPDRAHGLCWLGAGDPQRARPLLEAAGEWELAGLAAWQLGDHPGAVELWSQAPQLSEPNAARRSRAAALAGSR